MCDGPSSKFEMFEKEFSNRMANVDGARYEHLSNYEANTIGEKSTYALILETMETVGKSGKKGRNRSAQT